jgi:excisionase family DNA binding protein
MARLTKTEAARQLGISRTTLYKLIDQGRVSATPDGLIDETELVRAAPYVDILKERSRTSMDTEDVDMDSSHDEHHERPRTYAHPAPTRINH